MASVWENREYLMALMQRNPHDPLRQTAEKQWELLNQREAQAASLSATHENIQEQTRSREAGQAENVAQREARAKELVNYRQDLLTQRAGEEANQQAARILSVLPEIQLNYPGPEGQAMSKAILSQFLTQHGVNISPNAAPDAVTEATKRYAASAGKTIAPTAGAPPTAAPAGTPPPTTGAPPTAGVPGTPPAGAVGAVPTGGAPPPAATGNVASERTFGPTFVDPGPALPTNWLANAPKTTGPSGAVTTQLPSGGTASAFDRSTPEGVAAINEARKESSRLQGIPFSPVSLVAKTTPVNVPTKETMTPFGPGEGPKLAGPLVTKPTAPVAAAAAETPARPPAPGLNERLGATGEAISKFTDPLGTAAKSLFGGGGPEQIVKGGGGEGPTPEPTPSGPIPQGPFSGSIGNITQGPQPTPAGTPPLVPTPPPSFPPTAIDTTALAAAGTPPPQPGTNVPSYMADILLKRKREGQ